MLTCCQTDFQVLGRQTATLNIYKTTFSHGSVWYWCILEIQSETVIQTLTHQFWLHQNFKLVSERLHRLHTTWNTLWISAQWEMEIITTQTLTAVLWQAFLLIVSQHLQLHLLIQEPEIKLKKKQFFSFHHNKDHNLSSSSSSYEWTLLNSINSLVSLCEHWVDLC